AATDGGDGGPRFGSGGGYLVEFLPSFRHHRDRSCGARGCGGDRRRRGVGVRHSDAGKSPCWHVGAIAFALAFAAPAASADDMSKDSMSKDSSMKKDSMKKHSMKKDSMSKDHMSKDNMSK